VWQRCGRPGEDCEPSEKACDCTSDCKQNSLPANEWVVALEGLDPSELQRVGQRRRVPNKLHAIEVHACDLRESLSVGPGGGVFMVSRDPDGGAQLSRRTTL
jgi:hypothetical protein